MSVAGTFYMYTKSPPGDWPIITVRGQAFEYARSTFDVWPELLAMVEERRRLRRDR